MNRQVKPVKVGSLTLDGKKIYILYLIRNFIKIIWSFVFFDAI